MIGNETISTMRSTLCATVSASQQNILSQARPGGSLGCCLDEDVLDTVARHGRVSPSRQATLTPPSGWGKLPPSMRLLDGLSPVKNQGERGTCVAFASVALREFLAGTDSALSEQFLYWACKELDGVLIALQIP